MFYNNLFDQDLDPVNFTKFSTAVPGVQLGSKIRTVLLFSINLESELVGTLDRAFS